jgi:hypothetical protein
VYMTPPPPAPAANTGGLQDELNKNGLETDADRLRERYKQIGDAQGHKFGEGAPGSKPPDFNIKLPAAGTQNPSVPKPPTAAPPAAGKPASAQPGAAGQQKPPASAVPVPRPEGTAAQRKTPAPPPQDPPKPSKPVDPFL